MSKLLRCDKCGQESALTNDTWTAVRLPMVVLGAPLQGYHRWHLCMKCGMEFSKWMIPEKKS